MNQQVLYDQKWIKFLRRTWPFRWIPFVDFVLAAGSMALGNVNPESDFDVIVGVKQGRIFTARFFCVLVFGLLGWRRRRLDHKETAMNKICLNHFVTEKAYRLSPPHNPYWQSLYKSLAPLYGTPQKINEFFAANADWLGAIPKLYQDDLRHKHYRPAWFKKICEYCLDGAIGDYIERILKYYQIKKIETSLREINSTYKPRLIYSDDELEFHPDTRRIEILQKLL